MAVNPSSLGGPKPQFELSDGTPAVGNRLFFYVAGSSTKQSTYTDSTGGSANTNPIVLNALGMPTTEIWFTAGQSYKVVYAPPGSDDPPNSPIFTVDNLRGINDTSVTISQWVASGITPTFVSTTSFTLPGDQTTEFHPGRRILTTNTGGSVYSYIVTSVFGALTTVTVLNDGAGVLDSGLSAVSYGLLTTDNPSTPLLTDTYPIVSGSSDKTKKLRFEVDGLTTATTRVATWPDKDGTVAMTSDLVAAASQSEQETGTATTVYVSPGRQQFHASAVKAWGKITAATTVDASYPAAGVSINNSGTGVYVVTHGLTFSSANYAVNVTVSGSSPRFVSVTSRTTTTFTVTFYDNATVAAAVIGFDYACLGDL